MMYRQLPHLLKCMKLQAPIKQCHPSYINSLYLPAIASNYEIRNISTFKTPLLAPQTDNWLSRKMTETRIRLGLAPRLKPYYRLRGLQLYRGVETVDWKQYFKVFQMPDTFHSWFLIIELHMWMLNVRINVEGKEGDYLKQFSLEYMWEEARKRAKQLESYAPSAIREGFDDLYEELTAAFLMYDHGLLSSDVELANALWYRFLQQKCDDPEKLELLVKHVRKQIHLLETLSKIEFVDKTNVTWLPLSDKRK